MNKRSHPARRARTAVGIAGATTYVGLVWVIAAESQSEASINLNAALENPGQALAQDQGGLQLNGGATPQGQVAVDPAAVNAQLVPAQSSVSAEAGAQDPATGMDNQPSSTVAPGTTPTQPSSTAAPTTAPTTAAPTTAAPTTAAPTSAGQTTAPTTATTAAPTTAPTTAPPTTAPTTTTTEPTTTTTSSGS